MKNLFRILTVALLAAVALPRVQAQQPVSWETNLTATLVNHNDPTNSTIVVGARSDTKWIKQVIVETPAGGAVAWSIGAASNISTGTVANLPAIPKSTYQVINLDDGFREPLHMRFQTVETNNDNVVKLKLIGWQ